MKIIAPSFALYALCEPLTPEIGVKLLRWIEQQARISHRSEDAQTETSYARFIPSIVVQHGDWSICEHSHVTAVIRTDRGITHELVRHRLFSYTQESTRFCNYKKKGEIEIIRPFEIQESNDWGSSYEAWHDSVSRACHTYLNLLDKKVRPQEARSVLPNCLASTISVTGNLRAWRWLFQARTSQETHPDFRTFSVPMLKEFQRCIPYLFDDLVPFEKQSFSMAKAH